MSHQDDWHSAGVTERLMENGRKDHTQSLGRKLQWLQRPGRCKVGTTGHGGLSNWTTDVSKQGGGPWGLIELGIGSSCYVGMHF